MNRATLVTAMLGAVMLIASVGSAQAQEAKRYKELLERYPAPILSDVDGREYKSLLNPAMVKGATVDEGLVDLWQQIRAGAAKADIDTAEREENAYRVTKSSKEYLDTPNEDLWKAGYLIRIMVNYRNGEPQVDKVRVTVKAIADTLEKSFGTPLEVVGIETRGGHSYEENVFIGTDGVTVSGNVEKGIQWELPLAELGSFKLSDFAKYMPELLDIGLPADTQLVSTKAYSYRLRPGFIKNGPDWCGISMEAWVREPGGPVFVYDFSWAYKGDFYAQAALHAAGEKALHDLFAVQLRDLELPPGLGKWGGSKVRVIMNRPK